MKNNRQENSKTSFALNLNSWEEQNGTYSDGKKEQRKHWNYFQILTVSRRKYFGERRSSYLENTLAEIDLFLQDTLKDPKGQGDLTENISLIRLDVPTTGLNLKEQNSEEIKAVLKRIRSTSAPRPNVVFYYISKRCLLLYIQWKLLKIIWRGK